MPTTAKRRQHPRVDPELLRQLDQHAADARPVEAVFTLRGGKTARSAKADETEAAVRRLLRRVEAEVGVPPVNYNVFRNLGTFVVVASPEFVRALAAQGEIATATANRQPQSMVIPPRARRPVPS
ncbi:MAG: hypothetical protein QN178_10160 [Armatimonadota bacterium]|nr:hypothetical protein [Armatimonadota bacterium]